MMQPGRRSSAITPMSTTTRRARRGVAEALRQRIGERFVVQLGRWHDVPVGPHTAAMYQVAFDARSLREPSCPG